MFLGGSRSSPLSAADAIAIVVRLRYVWAPAVVGALGAVLVAWARARSQRRARDLAGAAVAALLFPVVPTAWLIAAYETMGALLSGSSNGGPFAIFGAPITFILVARWWLGLRGTNLAERASTMRLLGWAEVAFALCFGLVFLLACLTRGDSPAGDGDPSPGLLSAGSWGVFTSTSAAAVSTAAVLVALAVDGVAGVVQRSPDVEEADRESA
jgi:hypothetical protein